MLNCTSQVPARGSPANWNSVPRSSIGLCLHSQNLCLAFAVTSLAWIWLTPSSGQLPAPLSHRRGKRQHGDACPKVWVGCTRAHSWGGFPVQLWQGRASGIKKGRTWPDQALSVGSLLQQTDGEQSQELRSHTGWCWQQDKAALCHSNSHSPLPVWPAKAVSHAFMVSPSQSLLPHLARSQRQQRLVLPLWLRSHELCLVMPSSMFSRTETRAADTSSVPGLNVPLKTCCLN